MAHNSFHVWMQFHTQSNTQSFHYIRCDFYAQLNASSSTLRFSVLHLIITRFVTAFNQTIALTIPVLITFLQLKYQNQSPFSTHPRAMLVAISGCIVYYLAYVALLRYDPLRSFAPRCLVLSGHLAVASLTSVLLPDDFSPFVFAVFVLLSVSELLYSLKNIFSFKLYMTAVFQTCRRWAHRFLGRYSRQRPHILPLCF